METEGSDLESAQRAFGRSVREFRAGSGLSQDALARQIPCHRTTVAKVEAGSMKPTARFARRADIVLRAGGKILSDWQQYEERRTRLDAAPAARSAPEPAPSGPRSMRVVRERTLLARRETGYDLTVMREIENRGEEAINAFPIRVHVDAYPNDAARSREHHRRHPIVWEDLDFHAWHASSLEDLELWLQSGERGERGTELMHRADQLITDTVVEGWILFRSIDYREPLPLLPGDRAVIGHTYTVPDPLWGPWYQRHLKYDTGRLEVELRFPRRLNTRVWVQQLTAGRADLHPAERVTPRFESAPPHDWAVWSWSSTDLSAHDRYRFEWRFADAS
ncbi:helix-turn-helix transcriptional regulator [Dactylosporangium sp. NPDC051485]|uniref:helix-turn-helix transcriptional regulator n=1 Tax=Dactylosporangium sp. NPDC051485 TaxID=3154846 RepID=UPI0034201795